MSFTYPFTYPFYTGTASISSDVPWPYPVALDGVGYVVDLRQYQRETIDPFRSFVDQSDTPGERSLSPEGVWKRNRFDWRNGAGQLFADDEDSDPRRFYTSRGIDPWTRRQLCLLKETDVIEASTSTDQGIVSAAGYLYHRAGTALQRSFNPLAGSPSWASLTAVGGSPTSEMTTDGTNVWIAYAGDVDQYDNAGTQTQPWTGSGSMPGIGYTVVAYVNGWLLAAYGPNLHELAAGGTINTVHTFPANAVVTQIASAPNAIYLGVTYSTTQRSAIYRLTVDSTGALETPIYSGELPDGESLEAIAYYGGRLVLGTSRGVRLGVIAADDTIVIGPLIDLGQSVSHFEPQGEFVWFNWDNYDANHTGLGRLNLARFTDIEVPAYASDLMYDGSGPIAGIVTWSNERIFVVSGVGLLGEQSSYVESGVLNTGWISYGLFEPKVLLGFDVRHDFLVGSVSVAVANESGVATNIGTSEEAGSVGPDSPWPGKDVRGEKLQVQLTLERGVADPNSGPCLERWTAWALPAPATVERFVLPIICRQSVESDDQDLAYDPLTVFEHFSGLARSREPIVYQEGHVSYEGTVRAVSIPRGFAERWDDQRRFMESIVFVTMVSQEL